MDLVGGAVDPRGGYVSKILHVKMKESGPVGGGVCRARPPRSTNAIEQLHFSIFQKGILKFSKILFAAPPILPNSHNLPKYRYLNNLSFKF